MRRPNRWVPWAASGALIFLLGEYLGLTRVAPQHVVRVVEQAAGGRIAVQGARLSSVLTTELSGLRLTGGAGSSLRMDRVVIRPQWVSIRSRTIWLDAVEIERPVIRLTRTGDGSLDWPRVSGSAARRAPGSDNRGWEGWSVRVGSLKVLNGTVEFVDEGPDPPFHGSLDHFSLVVGPVTFPLREDAPRPAFEQEAFSFAMRGELVGHAGEAAPLYCSGWLDLAMRDAQVSCQLEPLALAAFEPYYHGRSELRVYTATVKSTSQWLAKANQLNGRVRLELNHLGEGDLSVRGRTILDIKRLTHGEEPRLSGELALVGLLDRPGAWHAEFLPGNPTMRRLIERLLAQGVEVVRIPLWMRGLHVSLAPASNKTMIEMEAASREVEEALEILALPPAGETLSLQEAVGRGTALAPAVDAPVNPSVP